ncbi:NOV [Symbiodinium microadriaticum]|nr:NOV [Symbiodinium microadriaticum]
MQMVMNEIGSRKPEQSLCQQFPMNTCGGELALPADARRLAAEAAEGGPDNGASLEEAVVRDIRKGLRRGVAEMRRSLTAAVDRLARRMIEDGITTSTAKDLYESQAHFVQADDNSYGEGVQPRINLVLRGRSVPSAAQREFGQPVSSACDSFANNEKGLTEATGTTTGYKGVGWKSVFRVTDEPHVLSRGWRFKFSSAGLGMLTPQWLEDSEVSMLPSEVREAHSRGDTVFYLPLSDPSKSVPSIRTEMQTIQADSAQLLFLRRVTEISLKGDWAAEEQSEEFADAWARIMVAGSQDPRAATTRQRFQQTGSEPPVLLEEVTTRFQISSHEDVLVALPKVEEPPPQRVFAFLPVRSVGFRFAIQAPFHLTASRADLHRSPENLRRRNAVAPAFIKACQANSELAAQAVEFLGTEPADHFWLPIRQSIVEALQNLARLQAVFETYSPSSGFPELPVTTPWHAGCSMDKADRVKGLVLGCALGDAVGLATEFMTAAEAKAAYEPLLRDRKAHGQHPWLRPGDAVQDGHRSKWRAGDWTDDTDQLVLVLRCLLPAVGGESLRPPEPTEFAERLVSWHKVGFPELGDTGGCGMGRSTARVLDEPTFLARPADAARRAWDLLGRSLAPNGALMRSAATGLRGCACAAEDARALAEVTHADPRSTAACVAVAELVAAMLQREDGLISGTGIETMLSQACVSASSRYRGAKLPRIDFGMSEPKYQHPGASAERYLPHEDALGPLPPAVWSCSFCTLENPPDATTCDACGASRPEEGQGTVHAGFGVAWSEQDARSRAYTQGPALKELRAAMRGLEMPVTDASDTLGYVNTCLAAGLATFRRALEAPGRPEERFCQAIHFLTMAAGDADTNAAVAGALLGCAFGAKALPESWLVLLPHRTWLEQIASEAAAAATASRKEPVWSLKMAQLLNLVAAFCLQTGQVQRCMAIGIPAQSLTADAGRELGIREFGYKELIACISWANGHWLQDLWRAVDRRSAAFTDLFQSLVDNILEACDGTYGYPNDTSYEA